MSGDEQHYPDPEGFRPERFLGHPGSEDRAFNAWNYIFGTGKGTKPFLLYAIACVVLTVPRKCPGMHLIQTTLWLVIPRVVATLDTKPKVVNGGSVRIKLEGKERVL